MSLTGLSPAMASIFHPELKYWIVMGAEKCGTDETPHLYKINQSTKGFQTVSECHADLKAFLKAYQPPLGLGLTTSILLGKPTDGLLIDYNVYPQDIEWGDDDDQSSDEESGEAHDKLINFTCDRFPWCRWSIFIPTNCSNPDHFKHHETSMFPFETSAQCTEDFAEHYQSFIAQNPGVLISVHKEVA